MQVTSVDKLVAGLLQDAIPRALAISKPSASACVQVVDDAITKTERQLPSDPGVSRVLMPYIQRYTLMCTLLSVCLKISAEAFNSILLDLRNKHTQLPYVTIQTIGDVVMQADFLRVAHQLLHPRGEKLSSSFQAQHAEVVDFIAALDADTRASLAAKPANLVLLVIVRRVYMAQDRRKLVLAIEQHTLAGARSKVIEVVDRVSDRFDYASIEDVLRRLNMEAHASELYDMLQSRQTRALDAVVSADRKVEELFAKGFLVPIVEDFLRYHRKDDSFDGNHAAKIHANEKVNKKDNTKLRYIVTKVSHIRDYHRPGLTANERSDIDKHFYQPLINRAATIINDLEEAGIVSKAMLSSAESSDKESLDALLQYRRYPYVGFKALSRPGFVFEPKGTLEALRYVNVQFISDKRFSSSFSERVQWRVMAQRLPGNVVGVMLPMQSPLAGQLNRKSGRALLQCLRLNDMQDAAALNVNGMLATQHRLLSLVKHDRTYRKRIYWLFNPERDKFRTRYFANTSDQSIDDTIKFQLSLVYDTVLRACEERLKQLVSDHPSANWLELMQVVHDAQSRLLLSPRNSAAFQSILSSILERLQHQGDTTDTKETRVNTTTTIPLPLVRVRAKRENVIRVSAAQATEEDEEMEDAVCQHEVTWRAIRTMRATDINRQSQAVFEFIKRYVQESSQGEYVCKSCFQHVDIQRYTSDSYQTGVVVVNTGLAADLETIPEYTQYVKAIKTLDKLVEKISYGSNMTMFFGNTPQIRYKRQDIIKAVIDLAVAQNKTLYNKDSVQRRQRTLTSAATYGFDAALTNFFLFNLDNDIFMFSSKDTDKFKRLKLNNVVVYLMLMFVLELNTSQVILLSQDKFNNYYFFEKFGLSLFNGLLIRSNDKDEVVELSAYRLLCYVIYFLATTTLKHNLWFSEQEYKYTSVKTHVAPLKSIITTFVDMLNSILEVNTRKDKNFLYEVMATRFFSKLHTTYDDRYSATALDMLGKAIARKIEHADQNKVKFKTSQVLAHKNFELSKLAYLTYWQLSMRPVILKVDKRRTSLLSWWQARRRESSPVKPDQQDAEVQAVLSRLMDDIAHRRLSEERMLAEKKQRRQARQQQLLDRSSKRIELLKTTEPLQAAAAAFVATLVEVLGESVSIAGVDYHLTRTRYALDHDYKGVKRAAELLPEPAVQLKRSDAFFKQDVLAYHDKNNNVTLFYSSIDGAYIGYKEQNSEVKLMSNTDCYLVTKHSLQNQLAWLGFDSTYVQLGSEDDDQEFLVGVLRGRFYSLRRLLAGLLQALHQVRNGVAGPSYVVRVMRSRIKKLQLYTGAQARVFGEWLDLQDSLTFEADAFDKLPVVRLPNEKRYIHVRHLARVPSSSDTVIKYMLRELATLVDINKSEAAVALLVVVYVNQAFSSGMEEERRGQSLAVRRFRYMIEDAAESVQSTFNTNDVRLTEEEQQALGDEMLDAREAEGALDATQGMDSDDEEDVSANDTTPGDY